MPICPKCRSEYENHISNCPDCKVNLVATEADIVEWYTLITTPVQMKEYVDLLSAEGITDILYEYDSEKEGFSLMLKSEDMEHGIEIINEWMRSNEENDRVVLEVEDVSSEDEKIALKNNVSSYYSIAGVLLVLAMIDFASIIPVVIVTKYFLGIISSIGAVICIVAAIKEKAHMTTAIEIAEKKEKDFQQNLVAIQSKIDSKVIAQEIKDQTADTDEGSKYYIAHDVLKKHLDELNLGFEESYINTIVDQMIEDYLN